jgi:hypothetical protein
MLIGCVNFSCWFTDPNPTHAFSTPSTPMPYSPALPLPDGSRTFRCKWEGMPGAGRADVARQASGGGGHRGSAGGSDPALGTSPGRESWKASHRAGTFASRQPKGGRGACHRTGPVADMAGRKRPTRVRAGSHARRRFRGLSGPRPGQPGRRALKRGRRISRLRGLQGAACRMPDSIRRLPGRARSAPPSCMSGSNGFI